MSGPLDVILPCLDEAEALPGVLAALPVGYRPLVVDNGSTDGTAEVAPRSVPSSCTNRAAATAPPCTPGWSRATAEVVAVLDGDGSLDPAVLPAMVGAAGRTADLVGGAAGPGWPRGLAVARPGRQRR